VDGFTGLRYPASTRVPAPSITPLSGDDDLRPPPLPPARAATSAAELFHEPHAPDSIGRKLLLLGLLVLATVCVPLYRS
jgi:hypothetical protein